jgi:hypothetical protein
MADPGERRTARLVEREGFCLDAGVRAQAPPYEACAGTDAVIAGR